MIVLLISYVYISCRTLYVCTHTCVFDTVLHFNHLSTKLPSSFLFLFVECDVLF